MRSTSSIIIGMLLSGFKNSCARQAECGIAVNDSEGLMVGVTCGVDDVTMVVRNNTVMKEAEQIS